MLIIRREADSEHVVKVQSVFPTERIKYMRIIF